MKKGHFHLFTKYNDSIFRINENRKSRIKICDRTIFTIFFNELQLIKDKLTQKFIEISVENNTFFHYKTKREIFKKNKQIICSYTELNG